MRGVYGIVVWAFGTFALSNTAVLAAPGDLQFEFVKPNHAGGDTFGQSMTAWQDNVLISAPFDDTVGNGAGAVYMYDSSGNLLQTYDNPTPYSGPGGSEYFGNALGTVGSSVLISDPYDSSVNEHGGAVYMFDAANGQLQRTFLNPNGSGGEFLEEIDHFGSANGVSGVGTDRVLVGAWNRAFYTNDNGIAYLFSATTGALLHSFHSPRPQPYSRFGYSTLGVGGKIAIGQPMYDVPGAANAAGAVHIYDADTYDYLYSLYDPTPDRNAAQFGISLAAMGDRLIVGGGGGAFLFDLDTGDLSLEVSDERTIRSQVAAVGNNILAGAEYYGPLGETTGDYNIGRAYLFDGRTGETLLTFENPDPDGFEYFGGAVAAVGNHIAIGADYDDTLGTHSGKVYMFQGVVPEPTTLVLISICSMAILTRRPR